MPLITCRGRWISLSSRPAWFKEWIPGQPGLLHRETVKRQNKTNQPKPKPKQQPTRTRHHTWLITWILGILSSSCLHSKHPAYWAISVFEFYHILHRVLCRNQYVWLFDFLLPVFKGLLTLFLFWKNRLLICTLDSPIPFLILEHKSSREKTLLPRSFIPSDSQDLETLKSVGQARE